MIDRIPIEQLYSWATTPEFLAVLVLGLLVFSFLRRLERKRITHYQTNPDHTLYQRTLRGNLENSRVEFIEDYELSSGQTVEFYLPSEDMALTLDKDLFNAAQGKTDETLGLVKPTEVNTILKRILGPESDNDETEHDDIEDGQQSEQSEQTSREETATSKTRESSNQTTSSTSSRSYSSQQTRQSKTTTSNTSTETEKDTDTEDDKSLSANVQEAYDELGIEPTEESQEIREAYRERVQEAHPDQGGSAEEFKRVQSAYETLLNWTDV